MTMYKNKVQESRYTTKDTTGKTHDFFVFFYLNDFNYRTFPEPYRVLVQPVRSVQMETTKYIVSNAALG